MFDSLFEFGASVLAAFYDLTSSYGWSIVLLTLVVYTLVMPLTIKSTRSMMAMQRFQPEMKRIQQEFRHDRAQLNQEMMEFYRANNINPAGTCVPILIQMPVFIVIWRVIDGITVKSDGVFSPKYLAETSSLYKSLVGQSEMNFAGLDLARSARSVLTDGGFITALPYLAIIGVVTASSYYQQRQISGRNPEAAAAINPMQKNLMRFMPLMFAVFSFNFAAALGIYLVTSNLFRVGQQAYISKRLYAKEAQPAHADDDLDASTKSSKSSKAGSDGTADTKTPAKPKPAAKREPAERKPSGRVTEPKRASGRVTPKASKPADQARRSGTMPRRRVPNGPTAKPAEVTESESRRKRRR
ncbi:MAG: membrane protein insertase YidC [Acidimicrobiia bacterium]|nr:membrane protein insertase YidC [Acidimicrobiia bacterium]